MYNLGSIYVAIPSQPRTLSVKRTGIEATSVQICWEAPLMADSPITYYSISALNLNATDGVDEILVRNTTMNAMFYTVTGLLPGITYELSVVAVSQGGIIFTESQGSDPQIITTEVTDQWCVRCVHVLC